jgi:meso-butanediol dehydrogenase / (S,S)-butanediol dehydrogenase / diacetyl reductase
MAGKVAFITGAARGLGREIALALGASGHRLYLVDIVADRLEATAAELRSSGHEVAARVVDVSSRQQCGDAIDDCVAQFGELAVLVNCAAVMRMEPITDTSEEDWNRILAVNLSGPFFLTQAALPHIIAASGNVINVASSNGLTGTPYTGPYSATKAALINLTKTLAMEYVEHPIRVNAVCPGPMATDIASGVMPPPTIKREKIARYSGQRGLANAADVAKVVAFLASNAAAGVHGAIWTADLGTSAG